MREYGRNHLIGCRYAMSVLSSRRAPTQILKKQTVLYEATKHAKP